MPSKKPYRDWTPEQRARHEAYHKLWCQANRGKRSAARRRWRQANPEKCRAASRRRRLKHRYGMTPADEAFLLKVVDGRCAICRVESAVGIDHNHKTGKVRLPTCIKCNSILGMADDNIQILKNAILYLELFEED